MTDETKDTPARPSLEARETRVGMVGRKRVIMTKKFWSAEDIRRLFRTLDQDSSGRLSVEEFTTGLKELGFEMKDDAAKALYRKMDVDGDGKITETEFVKLMRNMNRDKLTSQLSTTDRQPTTTKKPKAVNITVVDLGFHDGRGQYKDYQFNRNDIHEKYCKDFPAWRRHTRWIDIYGSDQAVVEFIGNECELSSRMVDECTVKHSGKVQYYPDEPALFIAAHALFLTKRATQEQAAPSSPLSPLSPFRSPAPASSSSSGTTLAIPLGRLGRRSSIREKQSGFGDDEDDEAEDEDTEEKKDEPDIRHVLVPERFYESPRINMSQIVIICIQNVVVTIRRRSNNTHISQLFDIVGDDLKEFAKEMRSSLEAPSSKDLLLSFLHEINEHNHGLSNEFNDWKLALEKDINNNIKKYQARHLLDLTRTTFKAVQIVEPFAEDFVSLTTGEESEQQEGEQKGKLTRQGSVPTTDDEKKKRKNFASAQQFVGEKKAAFVDAAENTQRLLTQLKYSAETANQLGTYYKHQMDDRQSKSLGYLTVITGTIFPFQLATGVYGMNFEVLPELTWEYSYLMFWIINIIIMLLLLKFWQTRGFF